MTAQEFVQYMPPAALVATIVHVWEHFEHHDDELYVLRTCWEALVAVTEGNAATVMVWDALTDDTEMYELMEVVS